MKRIEIKVKTYVGKERIIEQAKLSAELDKEGVIFYKITGMWTSPDGLSKLTFMIDYSYERGKVVERYIEIMNELLDAQENALKK